MPHSGDIDNLDRFMHNVVNALPPLALSMPAIAAGIFVSTNSIVTSTVPGFLTEIAVALYLYWALCLLQMERVVRRSTGGNCGLHWSKALLILGICSPAAPSMMSVLLEYFGRGLVSLIEFMRELFPNSLPIANNALLLLAEHSVTVSIVGGFIVCAVGQYHLLAAIDRAVNYCNRTAPTATSAEPNVFRIIIEHPLIACISAFIAVPASFWMLGETPLSTSFGLHQDFQARAHLITFICFALSFGALARFNKKIDGALAQCQSAPPIDLKLAT